MELRNSQPITLVGTIFDAGGYALNNRNVFRGLHELGWKMGLEVIPGTFEIEAEEIAWFDSFRKFDDKGKPQVYSDKEAIKIFSHIPLVNVPRYKRNIIFTMTETRNPHPNFIKWCNKFYDELWTPTEWNRQSFLSNGLKIPAYKTPIGIDEIYCEENNFETLESLGLKYHRYGEGPEIPEGYKFLSVSRWSYRKGFDVLVKSFLKEFKKSDNVSLVIHSRHAAMSHDPNFYNYVKEDLRRIWSESTQNDSAPIYLCMDIIPLEFMPTFYANADCFISTSRGEGQSLPTLEAAKMGKPVICPNHTGFGDYVSPERTFSFDVDEWIVCNEVPEWSRGGWITAMFFGQEFPVFGDKTVDSVRELMRFVLENPQEAQRRVNNLIDYINKEYNWENIISEIDKRLLKLI